MYNNYFADPTALNLCISHADCMDGLFAARLTTLPKENCYFFNHSDPHELIESSGFMERVRKEAGNFDALKLFIVDYYLPLSVIKRIQEVCREANCLFHIELYDHHKTSSDEFNRDYLEIRSSISGHFTCEFNMNYSAASLVYQHLYDFTVVDDKQYAAGMPISILLVEDRDLFTKRFTHTDAFRRGFIALNEDIFDIDIETLLSEEFAKKCIEIGQPLVEQFNSHVERIAKCAVTGEYDGHKCKVVFCPEEFTSDVGAALYSEEYPIVFMVNMIDGPSTVWKVGIRSYKDFDSSYIARSYGGGGHPCASACRMNKETFFDFLSSLTK